MACRLCCLIILYLFVFTDGHDAGAFKDELIAVEKALKLLLEAAQAERARSDASSLEQSGSLQEILRRMLGTPTDSTENGAHKRSDDLGALTPVVDQLTQQMTEMTARITGLENDKQALLGQIQALQTQVDAEGSVYVRWGHTTCASSSELVYSGTVGGPLVTDHGSGSNLLCMPPNPVFDDHKRTDCGPSTIYGSEYEVCPEPHHNMDVVCAVCRSARSATLMVPATNVCPEGWTAEYTGHVMGGYGAYQASTDYVCVDGDPQDRPGGEANNNNGQLLYYTVAKCGTLPCPPYQNDKILTCAVCSK